MIPVILTGRKSEIVKERSRELGVVNVIQGSEDKVEDLRALLRQMAMDWNQVAYIGDDLNDLSVMRKVAWAACPCDAVDEIKEICQYVSTKEGGFGAVRDAIDHLPN